MQAASSLLFKILPATDQCNTCKNLEPKQGIAKASILYFTYILFLSKITASCRLHIPKNTPRNQEQEHPNHLAPNQCCWPKRTAGKKSQSHTHGQNLGTHARLKSLEP